MDYEKEFPSKYVYLPKVGAEATFRIKSIKKAESDNSKLNFEESEKVILADGKEAVTKKDLGYHIECEIDNEQILSITNKAAFLNVFKRHNVQPGESITVKHPAKGEWEVVKNDKTEEVVDDIPDETWNETVEE